MSSAEENSGAAASMPQRFGPASDSPHRTPEARRSIVGWILLSLSLGLGLGGACSTCVPGLAPGSEELVPGGRDRVGVVELVGEILDTTETVRQIRELSRRKDLRALVLRIDSPGGAVAPSQEIYSALREASRKMPVVASMGSVAASGGFWSAMGADYIFASPGTVTGSIGVITQIPDLRGIAEALHFKMRTFKSGALKDAGNPLREMTPADEALFTSLIEDIYGQFVTVIAERRKMDVEAVRKIADGRVLTGRAALEAGLVDELGGLFEAARKAVALANERGGGKSDSGGTEEAEDPTLVYPKKPMPGVLRLLTEGASAGMARGVAEGISRAAARAESALGASPRTELR